ncbi:tetratricopeptide repeat protein [Carboxylicivirga sp. N1Y90]|uniref:tetratricopeptide repeat protein n=1 Tax=Carboxylicivirga fragile TaxID=3417571 RepID=UPI003D34AC8C|nr:hypothetical protein [Marinilabiliaceae bacterium N1Y90]
MISKILRFVIAALAMAAAVWQFIEGNIGTGLLLVFLSGLAVLSYFKNEKLVMAFWFVRKEKLATAGKFLAMLKKPEESLIKRQLAYYYFLNGVVNSQVNLNEAEKFFKKAISTGLKMDHDVAMAKLQLAAAAMQKRQKGVAKKYLADVKKLDKSKAFREQVKMLQANLSRI